MSVRALLGRAAPGGFGRSLGTSFVAQGVAGVLKAATAVVAARLLGPDEFGVYSLAVVVVLMGFNLGNLGLSSAATYRLARTDDRPSTAFTTMITSVVLGAATAVVAALVLVAARGSIGVSEPLVFTVALISLPCYFVANAAVGLALGAEDYRNYNVIGAVTQFAVFVTTVIAGSVVGTALSLAWAWTLGYAVAAVVGWRVASRMWSRRDHRVDRSEFGRLRSFGLRNHASGVVTFLSYRVDLIVIGVLLGPTATGLYAAAVALAEVVWFFSQVASTVLFARIAAEVDVRRRRRTADAATRLVTLASVLTGLTLAALAGPCIRLVYGAEFEGAVGALRVVLVGVVTLSVSRMLANYIAAVGRPADNIVGSVVALVVNLGLNLVLVPVWGIVGAATATAVSYSLTLVTRLVRYSEIDDAAATDAGSGWRAALVPRRDDAALVRDALVGRT